MHFPFETSTTIQTAAKHDLAVERRLVEQYDAFFQSINSLRELQGSVDVNSDLDVTTSSRIQLMKALVICISAKIMTPDRIIVKMYVNHVFEKCAKKKCENFSKSF